MRKTALAAGGLVALLSGPAYAHHQMLLLQLSDVTQAQFAGYYVADYQGFYDEAAIEVIINPGGPGIAPVQVLAAGRANIIVDTMAAALASREEGLPLVNIAQPFKRSGQVLACRKDAGITMLSDLKGKTIGVPPRADRHPLDALLAKLGLKADGSPAGVSVLEQGIDAGLLQRDEADCLSTTSYGGYAQLIEAGTAPEDLIVFRYEDLGVATLQDGLYVLEDVLEDPDYVLTLAAFLHATMRGWQWARDHPVEAARIVFECNTGAPLTEAAQERMMPEINRLTEGGDGALDPADYERPVALLLAGGSGAAISRQPVGAWTHKVSDAAELGQL